MRRRCRSAIALAVSLGWTTSAEAHHGHNVSRLDAGGPGRVRLTQVAPPRLDVALDYRLSYFAQDELGSAMLQQLLPSLTASTKHQSYLSLTVPVGYVQTNPRGSITGGSEPAQQFGVGDVALVLAQELLSLFGVSNTGDSALALQAGISLPTGSYDGPKIRHTQFDEGPDGTTITTFDARTSLGAGSWSAQVALRGSSRLAQNFVVDGQVFTSIPLTETPDGARWGPDVGIDLGSTWILVPNRFALAAGPTFRWHGADRYESELGAALPASKAGRRKQLGANLGIHIGITTALRCSVGAHVPFWQDFEGLQLSETVSASGGCSLGLGL